MFFPCRPLMDRSTNSAGSGMTMVIDSLHTYSLIILQLELEPAAFFPIHPSIHLSKNATSSFFSSFIPPSCWNYLFFLTLFTRHLACSSWHTSVSFSMSKVGMGNLGTCVVMESRKKTIRRMPKGVRKETSKSRVHFRGDILLKPIQLSRNCISWPSCFPYTHRLFLFSADWIRALFNKGKIKTFLVSSKLSFCVETEYWRSLQLPFTCLPVCPPWATYSQIHQPHPEVK